MQFASHDQHQMSQVFLSNLSIDYGWEQDNLENLQESEAKQQTGNTQSSIKYNNVSSSNDSKKQLMVITRQAAAFNFDQSLSMERECQKCQKFQQKIQQLNNQIVQLTNQNQWFKRQNDQILLNQQMLMDEQATKQAETKDLQVRLGQMELQMQKQQNSAQFEITSLKTKLIEYENRVLEREYDFQLIEQLKRQNVDLEESYKHKISELQVFIRQQEQYHQKAQLEQLQQCSRKNSLASLSLQYKSQIAKEKSPPAQEQLQINKFVECIVDMVANCTQKQKDATKPTLQQCWKWLKNILEEYMHLKKMNQKEKMQHTQSKEIITQKQYLMTDVDRRNTKRDISKRNQTTFEDKENQFINSNINISKQWN